MCEWLDDERCEVSYAAFYNSLNKGIDPETAMKKKGNKRALGEWKGAYRDSLANTFIDGRANFVSTTPAFSPFLPFLPIQTENPTLPRLPKVPFAPIARASGA